MTDKIRIALEIGPKGKKVVAVAVDWPGLERAAKSEEAAVEKLGSYFPRYAPIAKLAGMERAFNATKEVNLVEHFPGTSSTDFWGVSFAFSSIDKQEMTAEALERELTLMQACWAFFDGVRGRVSAEMQRGPRGGGRDREHIVRHTLYAELDFSKKVNILTPFETMLTEAGLNAHRDAYCQAIREFHAQGKLPGKVAKWPLRYLVRHTAYHTLDHAWEMEDKDLTTKDS